MGYTKVDIKSLIPALGVKMAGAIDFEKAWRQAYKKTDYSLTEPLLHKKYLSFNHRMGMEVHYHSEKSLIDRVYSLITMGPWKLLYKNDDVYVFIVFSKHNDNPTRYITTMVTGHLEDERLTRHEIVREVLDYDPSEGQD